MLTRDEALSLLKSNLTEEHMFFHSLESEAILKALALKLNKDIELWGLTGLLHDLDYSKTANEPEKHGLEAAEILKDKLPEDCIYAIKAHNSEYTQFAPKSELDYALRCGETLTGLIHANALMRPEKMNGMTPKSLKKKMKSKAFAANVNRDLIKECSELGIELGDFFALSIEAISEISDQVGLN